MPIACLSTSSPSTLNRWLPAWHSAPLKGNGVAISRRRYPQQDNGLQCVGKTIKQSITPKVRRDTCSDAKEEPIPNLLQVESVHLNPLNHCAGETGLLHGISPWGRFGCGLFGAMDIVIPSWMVRIPGNSVGVAFSRRRYTQSDNIVLYISAHQPGAVTPAAKRNTYSVAIMVVLAPRVAVFVRNPGESQHLQRCCCLRKTLFIFTRIDVVWESGLWAACAAPSPWKAEMGLLVYYVFSISLWEYRYSQQDIYLY